MKKSLKTLALACLTLIAATTIGQNINLRFTGTFTNGDYIRLDSVKVENLNRNWTEMLVYPDTVLHFNQTSISGAESSELELQSYPNPFSGKTSVRVFLPQSGNVTLQIHNLTGQKIAEAEKVLKAGEHTFGITLKNTEVNLLTIKTSNRQKTIKLLNNGSSVSNSIIYNGMGLAEKRLSTQNFQVGDVLRIAGYASVYGIVVRSREILQSQTASENFTLFFETANYRLPTVATTATNNITDSSAVSGGSVTDSGGLAVTARGVCWDTATNPTISNSHTTDGIGVGTFTSNITGLLSNTTYHVRAYATNAAGTAYGNDITFTTMASLPTVTTTAVYNITDSSAVSGGNVIDNGGASVTARGICWDTSNNPTISDNHTTDSNGNGTFTSNITGLLPNTTYHVRAYATNIAGTAYGAEMTFTTMASLPTVTTTIASNITDSSAVSGGNVTSNGGAAIIARGVCWDTSHNPTTSSSHTTNGTGVGTFTSNITGLLPSTTYYVRAYATNTAGTAYGAEITFVTEDTLPEGALRGIFSIGANKRVRFSKGNLQWSASGTHTVAGGGTAAGTWRFALNQWDTIGSANNNISSSYTGWIDLFGWGTSGYHDTNDQHNTNYHPYSNASSTVDVNYNFFGYGPSTNTTDPSLTGTSANYDWGVNNAISNGGNQPGLWRTLTQAEWDTIINIRSTTSGIRYAKATVNGVAGLIIVPDNWRSSTYVLNNTNNSGTNLDANVITSAQWATLENAGCVFLPTAGSRNGSMVGDVGSCGYYQSVTHAYRDAACTLYFGRGFLYTYNNTVRYYGHCVRLVRDAR